jgi:GNAT superfamily N-acetyltransferase
MIVQGKDSPVELKLAEFEQIDQLIEICRTSFPESLRWNGPSVQSRQWWKTMLESSFSETISLSVGDRAVGFYVLITDRELFFNERKKDPWRKKFIDVLRIAALFNNPILIFHVVKSMIRLMKPVPQKLFLEERLSVAQHEIAWGELSAISPLYRGKGLAIIMQDWAMNRCRELGKLYIGLNIESHNIVSVKLHESYGYTKICGTSVGLTYIKRLEY